eukprot:GFYU01001874.1.p1 GENE.GFYU01001874.1~~GFYU01001874.1.p1  ORF type:complete len:1068 (-),score=427.51 GFYU01001874.1:237-3440(-)
MASVAEVCTGLMDFANPNFDVPTLDKVVDLFYTTHARHPDHETVKQFLEAFRTHPDSWTRVSFILDTAQSAQTKFFALTILDELVQTRWKILPAEQKEGIKQYIVNAVIKMSSDDASLLSNKTLLHKLDITLVQVVKKEWPHSWKSFIPDIVGASKTNECLCENNMNILQILSEEVFDFSSETMTQAKAKELKLAYNNDFQAIFQLCEYIIDHSQKPSLISMTLQTLLKFLNWIPLVFIFETPLVEKLFKYFVIDVFRNDVLKCLTEIGGLSIAAKYDPQFVQLFAVLLGQLVTFIPPETDMNHVWDRDEDFVRNLALFFCYFLKAHRTLLETEENYKYLQSSLSYVVQLSYVEDLEVFKICLELWGVLASDLFYNECPLPSQALQLGRTPSVVATRRALYEASLSKARHVMISRMAKPEEVLVVEDDDGNVVKEVLKDTDSIALYKNMRETLIYLTHLNCEDTENAMIEKLAAQVANASNRNWERAQLNTLCWAIGSISGAMSEEDEKRFLVTVIKDLLQLCEMKKGKDNKAIIASNIMYVVGQYPRFLRAHWKFLKTVVNKLFEFMHELHPGVQDMACETFQKITIKCRRKFVVFQLGETQIFVEELLGKLYETISDLEPHQIHIFYEAVGYMISSQTAAPQRDALVFQLFQLPNNQWKDITQAASGSLESLQVTQTMKDIINILKTNVRAVTSMGQAYMCQLEFLYKTNLLDLYKAYSEMISSTIAQSQPNQNITAHLNVRLMRTVKRETLKLIETFIERAEAKDRVMAEFIPPLLDPVLGDYHRNIPAARDPEVLSLFACIINRMQAAITTEVPRIMEVVFDSTLSMITQNFEEYPEHRLNFFMLLRAINHHCFDAFFTLPPERFKLVIDSIVWAIKHTERKIAETGLLTLSELLHNVSGCSVAGVANTFHQSYFITLLSDILFVLTDTFHKPGFTLHAGILMHLLQFIQGPVLTIALNPAKPNVDHVRDHTVEMLAKAFPNLALPQVQQFVLGLFELCKDEAVFKNHLRDFLVQLKEFQTANNTDLYDDDKARAEAAEKQRMLSIPGMIAPHDRPDFNEMQD